MQITKEQVKFKATRAHGPGGMNVDHRSTKVHLWVKISDLPFDEHEKRLIREKLAHHINHKDEIWIENQETRSQEMNKDKVLEHLNQLIGNALKEPIPRLPTEPSRGVEEKRIQEKKSITAKKQSRRASKVV